MRTLPPSASTFRYVTHARYVARSLAVAGRREQSQRIRAAADKLRDLDRAVEDQAVVVFELKADRDFADRKGDVVIRDFRHAINARSRDAIKQPPATRIFPDGVEYYTAAPIAEQASRYRYLALQLTTHLAEDDPVRASAAQIEAGVVAYEAARAQLELAEHARTQAAAALARAERAFDVLMDKIYSALRGDLGRKAAERYFPKARK